MVLWVFWTASKTRFLVYFISIVCQFKHFSCVICCLKMTTKSFEMENSWSSKVIKYVVRAYGSFIHLQQKIKAVAFSRWNFFSIVCLETIIAMNNSLEQMRQSYAGTCCKWIDPEVHRVLASTCRQCTAY